MVVLGTAIDSILSLVLIIVGIGLVVFVVMKIGGLLLKAVVGILVNTILGFIVLFAIDYFFGVTVQWTLPVIASVALFGLPGVGTILLLKLGGVMLAIL